MSKRTLKIEAHRTTVNTGWHDATMTFEQFNDGRVIKAATIHVRNPYDLADIRNHCDQIEKSWKRQLGVA